MNTTVAKVILGYALGMAVGGASGYLVATMILKKKSHEEFVGVDEGDEEGDNTVYILNGEEVSKEEIEAWKAKQGEAHRESDDGGQYSFNFDKDERRRPRRPGRPTDYSSISRNQDGKPPLSEVAKSTLGPAAIVEPEETVEELIEEEIIEETIDNTKPYVISLEDYASTALGHTKQSITYYKVDDSLVDPNDDLIDNRDEVTGLKALGSFGKMSGEADTVYVRNLQLSTDFEIVRLDKSYTETILRARQRAARNRATRLAGKTRKATGIDDNGEEGQQQRGE